MKALFSIQLLMLKMLRLRRTEAEDKYPALHISVSSLVNNCSAISCLYNFNNGFNNRISVCQIKMILQQRDNHQGIFYKGRGGVGEGAECPELRFLQPRWLGFGYSQKCFAMWEIKNLQVQNCLFKNKNQPQKNHVRSIKGSALGSPNRFCFLC